MNWRVEWKPLAAIVALFLLIFYLPVGQTRFDGAVTESLALAKWYAREHVLLCLLPAFFIAGAIGVFIRQSSVIRYLGAGANKILAYGVASVSGSVLAVCSCTVLPLFAGIYRMGAGIGPASAFLYSGPAINVLAIILTARILGVDIGVARAIGAFAFSLIIGLLMNSLFRDEERKESARVETAESESGRPLWQNAIFFAALIGILVFANWGKPPSESGIWFTLYSDKWTITAVISLILAVILVAWFNAGLRKIAAVAVLTAGSALAFGREPLIPFGIAVIGLSFVASRDKGELGDWFWQTWGFAKQILPLLLAGVLVAGLLLGRPGREGLIPSQWIAELVGGNSIGANLFASVAGAFMYFATLTEVPILQGLMGSGMGKGPALALLLAGPALSLPSMLVLRSIMGIKMTAVYTLLVVIMATVTGLMYGLLF